MKLRFMSPSLATAWLFGLVVIDTPLSHGADVHLDQPDALKFWYVDDETRVRVAHEELILDGRQELTRAFFLPMASASSA